MLRIWILELPKNIPVAAIKLELDLNSMQGSVLSRCGKYFKKLKESMGAKLVFRFSNEVDKWRYILANRFEDKLNEMKFDLLFFLLHANKTERSKSIKIITNFKL